MPSTRRRANSWYSSEKIIQGWVHYGEPVVAAGKVFVVTWDAHVYAFGLKR